MFANKVGNGPLALQVFLLQVWVETIVLFSARSFTILAASTVLATTVSSPFEAQ
jgi:hypothetical protein